MTILQDSNSVMVCYFLERGLKYAQELRNNHPKFRSELLNLVQSPELADLACFELYEDINPSLRSMFSSIYDQTEGFYNPGFSNKFISITQNLETPISSSPELRRSMDKKISRLLRGRFDREEFKRSAFDYFTKYNFCDEYSQNKRNQAFREARKLFLRGLVDKIADEIWSE